MGRARGHSGIAVIDFMAYVAEVNTSTADGKVTALEAARIRLREGIADASIRFTHARNEVVRIALEDVRDARNIESKCAKARISPLVFDFGPDEAA